MPTSPSAHRSSPPAAQHARRIGCRAKPAPRRARRVRVAGPRWCAEARRSSLPVSWSCFPRLVRVIVHRLPPERATKRMPPDPSLTSGLDRTRPGPVPAPIAGAPSRSPAGTRHRPARAAAIPGLRRPAPCATPPDRPTGWRLRRTHIQVYCARDRQASASPARTRSPPAAAHGCGRSVPRLRRRWRVPSGRRRHGTPGTDARRRARRGSGRCW